MGCIFSGVNVLIVAAVWIAAVREPARRAAYLAQCQGTGFSAQQWEFLYAERLRHGADNAAAIAVAAGPCNQLHGARLSPDLPPHPALISDCWRGRRGSSTTPASCGLADRRSQIVESASVSVTPNGSQPSLR
jgi:hypothetical protein